jgi:hypothetical protein
MLKTSSHPHNDLSVATPVTTAADGLAYRTAANCAGARRLRSLFVTSFPSASVLGQQSSRLPAGHMPRPGPAVPRCSTLSAAGADGRDSAAIMHNHAIVIALLLVRFPVLAGKSRRGSTTMPADE